MSAFPPQPLYALALVAVLLPICAVAAPMVDNPADPPARETLPLRETWRAGGDDESILLGKIGVVVAGPDGMVYALDSQLSQVLEFDRSGEYQRTLGREGDGPGEFRQPVGMFLPGDGTIAVQQAFPGRISYLKLSDGLSQGTWDLGGNNPSGGGFAFMETARQRGGTFAVSAASTAIDQAAREMRNTSYLAIVTASGGEVARLAEVSSVRSMMGFTVDELAQFNPGERELWDIGPGGRIFMVSHYDAYEVAVHSPTGNHAWSFSRPHEARLRTEAEKEDVRTGMQINIGGHEPKIEWKVQDRVRCIDRIQVLDDGSIWILGSRGRDGWDDRGTLVYDVFSADGQLEREVTVTVPEGGEGDRVILMTDGRFMLVKGMDTLSISITAGNSDEVNVSDEELGEILLELVCFEIAH